ncbi:2,3-bisphosphoglycerate-independent phosphoglycerate mutase [Sulfurospirillum arcachonense]|uniref:2,3-bisphosphoglycerate-independent phosphoglycerate mutase n=1 Tax=Sulfurospirillum arcachonense TaxID=57666 RepID=UPI0004BB666E|nr:2,3-bisphosphoglycerate-independent phosphoglycerate mutase [Sulfurospirillum arcachonense]
MPIKCKKTVLIITDGIGHCQTKKNNAFMSAKKTTYDKLFKEIPNSLIQTSGLSVGLPEGQMGNSEVGHMSIGSGRVLYQNLVKISMALKDNSLRTNEALKSLLHVKGDIHIIGLLSDGGVHSHIDHIIGLEKIAKECGKNVYIHAIMDGRDVSPTSGINYIQHLEKNNIKIASISGRFYTMDRDNRWDRVKKGYDSLFGKSLTCKETPSEYIQKMYAQDITDEFIEPISFGVAIKEDDGVLFANFRNDRMREISKAVGSENFEEFQRDLLPAKVITMTEYDSSYDFDIMFKSEAPKNTLAEVISNAGLSQLHTAETEKYAHVTFFLNGGIEEPFANESRVLVPSPKVKTYDMKPEMSAKEVCDEVLRAMQSEYDFIVVNFANGDMVGHTGNFEAGVKAVEAVDTQLGRIYDNSKDYNIIQISDHGNCEEMVDNKGNVLTNHTTYDVYCFLKAQGVKKIKNGGLNNIAPTILKLMDLEIPLEMDEALI